MIREYDGWENWNMIKICDKEKIQEYNKEYREDNKEKIQENMKEYYDDNKRKVTRI
jgi:hypothetical protein